MPGNHISRHGTAHRSVHNPKDVDKTLIGETPSTCNCLKEKVRTVEYLPDELGSE